MEFPSSSFWIFRHLQNKGGRGNMLVSRLSLACLKVHFCTLWICHQGLPSQLKTTISNFHFQPQSLLWLLEVDTFTWHLPLGVLQDLKVLCMSKTEFLVIPFQSCSYQSFLRLRERQLHPFTYSVKNLVVIPMLLFFPHLIYQTTSKSCQLAHQNTGKMSL